jgi:DNA polymerase-3 subunit alpha
VTLGGRVTAVRRITTKRGEAMAAVQLEDMQGGIEVVVFPRAYAETSEVWREEAVVLVTGTVKLRDEEPQLVAEAVEVFEASEEEVSRPTHLLRITLRRDIETHTGARSDALAKVDVHDVQAALERFPGQERFELLVRGDRWLARLVPAAGRPGVRYCAELHSELEHILGSRAVEVVALSAELTEGAVMVARPQPAPTP